MNDPAPAMPQDFGLRYIFWMVCRWIWLNPLTILSTAQLIALQLMGDYPKLRWLGTGAAVIGIVIAQVRNRDKVYSAPLPKPQEGKP